MSEGKDGRDIAAAVNGGESEARIALSPPVNEDRDEVAVSPSDNEGEETSGITPTDDESQGTDPVSPVMSYEPGTDYLERFVSEGEIKYEGKGKARAASFSHLPTPGQSAPSTAPSTRPTSEVQDSSAPSTAPSTRPTSEVQDNSALSTALKTRPTSQAQDDSGPGTVPTMKAVSQAQADSEPSLADCTSSATEEKEDSAATTASGDSRPITGQGEPAAVATQGNSEPITGQGSSASATDRGDSAPIAAPDTTLRQTVQRGSESIGSENKVPTRNLCVKHDCGCEDIYDDTGKKRQQACISHRLDPRKSILSLPPKKPLSESTNSPGEFRELSVRTPRQISKEQSPPRPPPEVTSTKGRNYVQESENSPTFLDPFNSERAIEPTGPPDTLTTIPTQEDVPLKKRYVIRVAKPKKIGPEASEPKRTRPVTARFAPNPVEKFIEDASGSQADQPQKMDVREGQNLESRLPEDEQRTSENTTIEPRPVAVPGDDEHVQEYTDKENQKPPIPVNSPHHRQDITPKSILKKTAGTAAEARRAEEGTSFSAPVDKGEDSEVRDPSGGPKLFQATLAAFRAANCSTAAVNTGASGPSREDQRGAAAPRLTLAMNLDTVAEDSDDESTERARKVCPKCTLL